MIRWLISYVSKWKYYWSGGMTYWDLYNYGFDIMCRKPRLPKVICRSQIVKPVRRKTTPNRDRRVMKRKKFIKSL